MRLTIESETIDSNVSAMLEYVAIDRIVAGESPVVIWEPGGWEGLRGAPLAHKLVFTRRGDKLDLEAVVVIAAPEDACQATVEFAALGEEVAKRAALQWGELTFEVCDPQWARARSTAAVVA